MSKKIRLYLKTKASFDAAALDDLQQGVHKSLSKGDTFEIIHSWKLPETIDWRRFAGEPPHPLVEARFLTKEIDGIEVYAGGNTQHASIKKLIDIKSILKWTERLNYELPPIIPEAKKSMEHMLKVDEKWKHGSDEYVYKYCSWDVAKNFVLSGSKTLRFSDIGSMNDPLEFERHSINLYGVPGGIEFAKRYGNAINHATKNGVRYFCSSQDVSSDFNVATGFLGRPAMRGFAHPAMWNHYSTLHEGVCLILNKSKLNRAINQELLGKGHVFSSSIRYLPTENSFGFYKNLFPAAEGMEDWTEKKLQEYARRRALKNRSLLFFSKNQEWSYENEFRWAFLGDGDGPIDIPINDCLSGIILGSDFNNSFHSEAIKLANQNDIPVERIWWRHGFACPLWPLKEFEEGGALATWGERAAIRRANKKS